MQFLKCEASGCQISHLGTISIDVTGLGPLDWVLEMLVDLIANLFRVRASELW